MSTCINSKHDLVDMELNGNEDLVCLANGQMKHLFESQGLLCKKEITWTLYEMGVQGVGAKN